MKRLIVLIVLICSSVFDIAKADVIRFKAKDGLEITAELYMVHDKSAPFIVLFHQANWSRGEYLEIAPKLNSMGYNCMAVDLRSGGAVNDVTNITKQNAIKAMKETQYIDAYQDMEAAMDYADQNLAEGSLIIWGSSYSSALALKLAGENNKKINGVLAFSPGEYFVSQGKPRDFITSAASTITQNAFITSARNEKSSWWGMYVAISSSTKTHFLPETAGNHGSRALWSKFEDSKYYWKAVEAFLSSI